MVNIFTRKTAEGKSPTNPSYSQDLGLLTIERRAEKSEDSTLLTTRGET